MGELIHLHEKAVKVPAGQITLKPWEFRRPHWDSIYFVQRLKQDALEGADSHAGSKSFPTHYFLTGGRDYTIRALFASRKDERKMREIYFLAGLMDCMINQVNPILRTDLLRSIYKKVFEMKKDLNIAWYGRLDHVLFQIDSVYYDAYDYQNSLTRASTLKNLYQLIRTGTDEMFDILARTYCFYCPKPGV